MAFHFVGNADNTHKLEFYQKLLPINFLEYCNSFNSSFTDMKTAQKPCFFKLFKNTPRNKSVTDRPTQNGYVSV